MKYIDIIKSEDLRGILSSQGVYNVPQTVWIFSLIYLIGQIVDLFNIAILSFIVSLTLLYVAAITIQKRCRDIKIRGTLFILAYSLAVIISSTAYFVADVYKIPFLHHIIGGGYLVNLLLLFIPGKPDPDPELHSPLMKYPLGYTAFCFILAILATIAVNHLANV